MSETILKKLPDKNLIYREALEDTFSDCLEQLDDNEEVNTLVQMWNEQTNIEPLVYTMEEMEEAWGPDIEEGIEAINHAMDKDILREIRLKEDFLKLHFG